MASSLFLQLAQIGVKGPSPVDLKAQKSGHSESLLFSARDAAAQDFDTLFIICYEGFEELCRLDARFTVFTHNIFSEQSKYEDRNQMTVLQNSQLDVVLEEFLTLASGKLLLKSVQKAVEWLVRRFKVHYFNTKCLVLIFLPYHASPIFATLLSILPQNPPTTFKFLYPYTKSQTNPPRHVIVYAATHNTAFLAALNAHVLKVSRSGHHFPVLLSFWTSLVTEAVASMIDQSRSRRREVQFQKQEDLINRIVPSLNEGLKLKKVPDLQVGCYMVFSVLAMKASLDDKVLADAMNTVALNWSHTKEAGIMCVSELAAQRGLLPLPKQVFKSILAIDGLAETLVTLKPRSDVGSIALGVALSVFQHYRVLDVSRLDLVRSLIKADLLSHSYIKCAIAALILVTQKTHQHVEIQNLIEQFLLDLAEDRNIGFLIKDVAKGISMDLKHLGPKFQEFMQANRNDFPLSTDILDNEDDMSSPTMGSFDDVISNIPTKTSEISFLSGSDFSIFDELAQIFIFASSSTKTLRRFSELPVLRKHSSFTEPLFISFFIRFWCGTYPATHRAAAINWVCVIINDEIQTVDVQLVLPYTLFGLADPSLKVRHASATLIRLLSIFHNEKDTEKNHMTSKDLEREQIYGQTNATNHVAWLSREEAVTFTEDIILPSLEECLLDPCHISHHLLDIFNDPRHSRSSQAGRKDLKTSLRQKIFMFMCSHAVKTPLYVIKLFLLKILNQVEKVGNISRTKALLPLISENTAWNQKYFDRICSKEQIDPLELLNQIIQIVIPTDRHGVQLLQGIIESKNLVDTTLQAAAYQRIRSIWGSMKSDLQSSLAKAILELAVSEQCFRIGKQRYNKAFDTLRSVPLSTPILQSFLEGLTTIPSDWYRKPLASKRRRTSRGFSVTSAEEILQDARPTIRRLGLVLELIETCNVEQHPQLMKGLFQLLVQLQLEKNDSGVDMGYLQVLTMENMLSIARELKKAPSMHIDQSTLQPSIIVESIRATTSTQVQHVALLLISALASITPELVLHSVMPIFTFMNANILRQSDDYSAYIVTQTMDSIIPRLVQSLHERERDPIRAVSELLLSFVAAYEHIPPQRRLELFKSLVDKVGSAKFLFALLVILLDKHPGDEEVVQFGVNLVQQYNIIIQFQSIDGYLGVVLDILEPEPSFSKYLVAWSEDRTANSIVTNLLPLLAVLFDTSDKSSKVWNVFDLAKNNAMALRQTCQRLTVQLLRVSDMTTNDKTVSALSERILESLFDLLPTSELIRILKSLFAHAQDDIRQQILKAFQRRLNTDMSDHRAAQIACISFLPLLTSILEDTTHLPLRHASLSIIDTIVKKSGKMDLAAVFTAACIVAGDHSLGASENDIRIVASICLANTVELLREAIIPIVPTILLKSLDQLSDSMEEETKKNRLHNAAYSLIGSLLFYIPWTISLCCLERLLVLSHQSAKSEMGDICDRTRIETLRLVAKQVEPRVCFKVLDETWNNVINQGPAVSDQRKHLYYAYRIKTAYHEFMQATKEHLAVLRIAIDSQQKSSMLNHYEILTEVLLKAFDLRNSRSSITSENAFTGKELDEVESALFDSAIVMIHKLNNTTFRPIFLKFWEWATSSTCNRYELGEVYRRTTFYSFLSRLFESLRSIVVSYAGFIIEDAVNTLRCLPLQNNESKVLWRQVVITLHKAFEYDREGFWQSPAHFAPVVDSLLFQFKHASQISMKSEIIPAITALAASVDSASHHRELNSAILPYMRSDIASIRLAAIQCERSLTNRLGEEWLVLLPEMLPCISELQEDDSELVEAELQSWIVEIENTLGEKLNLML